MPMIMEITPLIDKYSKVFEGRLESEAVKLTESVLESSERLSPTSQGYYFDQHKVSESVNHKINGFVTDKLFGDLIEKMGANGDINLKQARSKQAVDQANIILRAIPLKTSVQLPPLKQEENTIMYAVPAALGAFIGQMVLGPIGRVSFGDYRTGLVLGAALGSAILVIICAYLSKKPELRKTVQIGLGITGTATVALKATGLFSPFKRIVGSVWPTRHRSFGGTVKALGIIVFSIWLLQITAAKVKFDKEELRKSIRDQVHNELIKRLLFTIAIVKIQLADSGADGKEVMDDTGALATIWKNISGGLTQVFLAESRDDAERSLDASRQLVSELNNCGVRLKFVNKGEKLSNEMLEYFDTFGSAEMNSPVQTLKPAWLIDEQVLVKGLVRKTR